MYGVPRFAQTPTAGGQANPGRLNWPPSILSVRQVKLSGHSYDKNFLTRRLLHSYRGRRVVLHKPEYIAATFLMTESSPMDPCRMLKHVLH
jgi:hypothetical protein